MAESLLPPPRRPFPTRRSVLRKGAVLLGAMALACPAGAEEIYSFQDDVQLTSAMLKLADRTLNTTTLPKPCELHIVIVAGGGELFERKTFNAMNMVLSRGVDRANNCRVQTHELARDGADALFARISTQGKKAFMLDITYIPITDKVLAFTKLRDGTGRLIGSSGRYDLPVSKVAAAAPAPPPEPVAPAPVETTAAVKETMKLLTEVHFNSSSADVTYVGKQKIGQAAEAIKKQKPREIRIMGFTDTAGSEAANRAMARARASNVARLLKEHGVDLPFVIEGKGEVGGPYSTPDNLSEPLNRCVGIIAIGGAE